MPGSKGYPQNFFTANEIIYRIAGLWIFERKEVSTPWKIARYFYSLITYGITISFLVTQFMMFKETVKETAMFISHFEMLSSHTLCFMKVATLLIQHKKLQRIIDVLQDKEYYYEPEGDFEPWKIFLRGKRISQMVSAMVFGIYSFVGITAYISAKVNIEMEVNGNEFAEGSSCYDFLMYYFYVPFPSETKRTCEVAIVFMSYSLSAVGWIIACHDTLYCSLVNCLRSHFAILNAGVRTIRKRVMRRLNLPDNLNIFRDEEFPELEEALYREITRLVGHLSVLLNVANDLEATFNLILLGQVMISLVSLASVLFVAATVPVGSPEFITQFQYFFCLSVQLGLYCGFGELIRTSSEDVLSALYDCQWLSASKRFKSTLLTTMIRMQRPLSLTFGKFCPLTVTSWVTVVKSSFSYYTVFKSINE